MIQEAICLFNIDEPPVQKVVEYLNFELDLELVQ